MKKTLVSCLGFLSYLIFLLTPLLVSAQVLHDIDTVAEKATDIGNLIIGIAISLAVLWIIVSVVRYLVIGGSDEVERKKGQDHIVYGIVGLFVILSIWGLVAILRNTFRTDDTLSDSELRRTTTLPDIRRVRGGSSGSSNPFPAGTEMNSMFEANR
jgi:amino acid transporter